MRMTRMILGISSAIGALMGSSQLMNLLPAISPRRSRAISRGAARRRNKTTLFQPNGKREVERRLRQIAAGQLTRANGLVTAEELYGRAAA